MNPEDQAKRRLERERGMEAERIIDSPVWSDAYEKMAKDINSRMLSPTCDDDETIARKRELLALYKVKKELETVLQTGQLASVQLEKAKNGNG